MAKKYAIDPYIYSLLNKIRQPRLQHQQEKGNIENLMECNQAIMFVLGLISVLISKMIATTINKAALVP